MASPGGRESAVDLTLLQERSAGTFSTVYVAESRSEGGLARIVAVKHLKEQWNGTNEVLDRTRDEARLLSRLQHKNILRVEALIDLAGRPAVVMEFVDGVDVKQLASHLAEQHEAFSPRAAYRIALCTASALDAAWNQVPFGAAAPLRVVHRDIKPSNMMVSKEGELKVLDFGTARFNHEARVAHTAMLRFGSLRYMSPERKEGGRGDHAGDIYSLGLVLLELLTGKIRKNLPVDRSAHDAEIASAISDIDDTGLPDERWDNTLFETLARMCAYSAVDRLTADQCVPLLRAFSEQARGDSLEALASRVVEPLAAATYGRLGEGPLPSLGPIPTPDPEVPLAVPSDPADPFGLPTERISTQALEVLRASGPGGTLLPPPRKVLNAQTNAPPPPTEAPAAPPAATPMSVAPVGAPPPAAIVPKPKPIPPPAAPTKSGGNKMVIIAAIAAFMVVGGMGVVALVAWTLMGRTSDTPTDVVEEAPPQAPSSDAEGLSVSVASADSRVRRISVKDERGAEVLRGKPNAEGTLPEGVYTIEVSMVGRPNASTTFELTTKVAWKCEPNATGDVYCEAPGRRLKLAR